MFDEGMIKMAAKEIFEKIADPAISRAEMEKMRNKVKRDFAENEEARELGMESVKVLLKGISDLCDENLKRASKDPKPFVKISTLSFASMLINISSTAETASEVLDMVLEGYKGQETKATEKEGTKESEKDVDCPKCFGRYLENRKHCDYDDCPVRKSCREEYQKHNE